MRVRSREGEEVTCSRKAASRAGTLSDWMDDTSDDGAFPTIMPTADLRVILGVCEDDDSSALATHSLVELVGVMQGANFLEAPCAFRAAARQLHTRFLACKSVEELRTYIGAENDMSKAEEAAALAEPSYTPQPTQEQAEGPLRVQRGVSLMAAEDVLEAALQEADATTLCRLKAVSLAWRTRARRELWRRLCQEVNAADGDGSTALMLAADGGHTETVTALLAAPGLEVNAANGAGGTALMLAAFGGHIETVTALLAAPGLEV